MKAWLVQKLIQAFLAVLDSWVTGALTEERALACRRAIEDATIGRAIKLDQGTWWKKKRSNNAFAAFMTVLLKSNRLTELKSK